ncbi:MAG: ankyrin repeat domain-containing protein [Planctomycetota bacterium]
MSDLFSMIASGDREGVEASLAETPGLVATPNEQGVSPLMWALYHRQGEIAEQIAGHLDSLSLHEAAALGDVRAVRLRLDARPEALEEESPDGFRALHLAAFFARPAVVHFLLARGADCGALAGNGSELRPLHSAVAGGDLDCARMLLEAGAPVNAAQVGGWTALHSAAKQGHLGLAMALLDHGADPRRQADDGTTPLQFAKGDDEMLALLGGGEWPELRR